MKFPYKDAEEEKENFKRLVAVYPDIVFEVARHLSKRCQSNCETYGSTFPDGGEIWNEIEDVVRDSYDAYEKLFGKKLKRKATIEEWGYENKLWGE